MEIQHYQANISLDVLDSNYLIRLHSTYIENSLRSIVLLKPSMI